MRASLPVTAALLAAACAGALCGCGARGGPAADHVPAAAAAHAAGAARPAAAPGARPKAMGLPAQLPGLGAHTLSKVPADARQAVVVTGEGHDSSRSHVVVYERTAGGWRAGAVWAARNADKGWSAHHMADDLRSPTGVFTLTDAGGRLPDPGTRLAYDHSVSAFTDNGTGFHGESLAHAFDYVIAINYNRVPGTTPIDWTRPLGAARGGGVWFHVDHGGPTHGCVSLSAAHMKALLRLLDPAKHPVVVMGDEAALAT